MKRPTPGQILLTCGVVVVLAVIGTKLAVALRSDETRVRMVLADVVRYALDRDPGGVLEYIDPEYRDVHGHTAEDVKGAVRYLLIGAKAVEAELTPIRIAVDGDVAKVRVRARGVVAMPGQKLTLASGGFRGDVFDLELKRFESYFRLTSAREARDDGEAAE